MGELITKGYCTIQFDDFKEAKVSAYPVSFPDIIGKQGAIVRKIKDELDVEVSLPETKGKPLGVKYDIKVAGKTEQVDKAVAVLQNLIKYGYSELTHPGWCREEMELEQWAYPFIIGKGGCELRHIQNNFKVKVSIPREHSESKNVVVVGDSMDVTRAKRYIESVIYQPRGRDKQDGAEDYWGGEDEDEEWMKPYLIKR